MGEIAMARKSSQTWPKEKRSVFYVALEGSVTERKYFDALIKAFNLRNVYMLKKTKTRSWQPNDVVKRLEREMRKRNDDHGDTFEEEYWAVIDTDDRSLDSLQEVASRAANKKICIAASNPCFELWLLLHYVALNQLSGVEGSVATGGCDKVIEYLKRHFDGNYDKSAFNPSKYTQKLTEAISNATISDPHYDDAWMTNVCSHVYKLVESIIDY